VSEADRPEVVALLDRFIAGKASPIDLRLAADYFSAKMMPVFASWSQTAGAGARCPGGRERAPYPYRSTPEGKTRCTDSVGVLCRNAPTSLLRVVPLLAHLALD
jgi:hypothetical protein